MKSERFTTPRKRRPTIWTPAMSFVASFAMAFTLASLGAIKHKRLGCGDDGLECLTGMDSGRSAEWSEMGPRATLGSKCEKFYTRMQKRLDDVRRNLDLPARTLGLRNFTIYSGPEQASGSSSDIRCGVEVYSKEVNLRIERVSSPGEHWIDPKDPNACAELLKKADSNPRIAASSRRFSAELFDGVMCSVDTLEISLIRPIEKPGRTVDEDLRAGPGSS